MIEEMSDVSVVRREIRTISGQPLSGRDHADEIAVEQPLQILIHGVPFRKTNRTPDNDKYLVTGLLAAEGLIETASELTDMVWTDIGEVDVRLGRAALERWTRPREQAGQKSVARVTTSIAVSDLLRLPIELGRRQPGFRATGATHAVGLFRPDATPLVVFEDIGRHNAFDKVLGWALRHDLWPASDCVVFVSGRQAADLVQKAVTLGVGIFGGVSAPTSLAVDMARDSGLTPCGFVRPGYVNVYAHPERVLGVA